MNLNGKNIENYFLSLEISGDFSKFPHGENYPNKYKYISENLNKWVHSEIDSGALSVENKLKSDVFLTKHGNSHIQTIIEKTSMLIDHSFCELEPFEIFLLLMAMHFHDIGNIFGRKGHEINAKYFIEKMGSGIVGQDEWIWDYVYDIARSHKGFDIDQLANEDWLHSIKFRPQLLASILKFGDELSENFSRASKVNLDIGNINDESVLHHKFASCVNTIIPRHESREIFLIFNLTEDDLKLKFTKNGESIFLLDEIYLRTLKTYFEKVYCSRYFRPFIIIDEIKVTIRIKRKNGIKNEIGYILKENIVNESISEFFRLNPDMKNETGEKWFEKVNNSINS